MLPLMSSWVGLSSTVEKRAVILPSRMTMMLSQSPIDYVLGSVARNPKTPASDLQSMFNAHKGMSGFYLIEWGLASNPATPGDIIEQLSLSDNEYTLRYLKTNPATPQSIKDAIPY